jgi:hypothetical protein
VFFRIQKLSHVFWEQKIGKGIEGMERDKEGVRAGVESECAVPCHITFSRLIQIIVCNLVND